MKKMLVFTDLDGSLLDHHDYSWSKATPALQALEEQDFPVVFTSSKTAAEIIILKQQIANRHPFISENGAAVGIPTGYFEPGHDHGDDFQQIESQLFSTGYQEIVEALIEVRRGDKYNLRGFYEMDIAEIASTTGLDYEQAKNAKQRQASEPLLWRDTRLAFDEFKNDLSSKGLFLISGGRFSHVMGDASKGKAVAWLLQKYRDAQPDVEWVTVGLGDSYNDVQMLEVVDYPVLISNANIRQPELSHIKNIQTPPLRGPAGWNQAILGLMKKIL